MRRLLWLAALAFLVASPAFAQPARVTLKIGLIPADFAGQAYFAKDLGFFERAGIDVEITPITNGAAIQAALASGALDVGYSNVIALSTAHERGVDFQFIIASNYYTRREANVGVLAVARASTIRNAADLEGKTIAVSGINEVAGLSVRRWMDENHADSKKAKFVELPFPAMAPAVQAGRVDAAAMNIAFAPNTGAPNDPLRIVAYTYDAIAPRWMISGWCVTPDWVAKHPEAAAKFIAAMKEATAWGNAHRSEASAILAKYLNKPVEQIEALPRPTYQTHVDAALLQPAIDAAAKYGTIASRFPARLLISSSAP
ncbi:MAG TPA: ABC transporter substrate-binding protein [Candidatus Acidoferrales bacterium]|jgi:NitT/TauT family transport system substrate-binding protein|nr:ABC transporter substrate-binding protein [Candidatus Acidoferrales bacterium]